MLSGLMMDYPLTIDRVLEHGNRLYPYKQIRTKLPGGGLHTYTYRDLYGRVKRLCNLLDGLGVAPGDRVGTFAWNNYQHVELYFGAPGAGAVVHTLNIRLFPEQLAFIINHAEDKVIFIDATLLPLIEAIAAEIGAVEHFVLFNTPPEGVEAKLPGQIHDYEALMAVASEDYSWRVEDENQAMGLCYTSGTTGHPKGALYSHRSMYLHTVGACQAAAIGLIENDVTMPVVPQFHAMAWGLPYAAINAGSDLVLPGPHMQPSALAALIEEERVTVAAGVPTIWNGLYHDLKQNTRDISCIRALVVGGSAMPRSLIEAYEQELGVNVVHAWGMTEMSPPGTISKLLSRHRGLPLRQQWDVKARQGYPISGVEMRIVDDEGAELPWDGESLGELQVRGPWVARAYYKLEGGGDSFTADGWFRTGDVATITADGFMTIVDRTKDMVRSGGEWISSVELENLLMAHPQVLEAAVIAVPHEHWQERPLAVCVPTDKTAPPSAETLRSFLEPQVAGWWMPDEFVLIDEIPKTGTGKFDKKVLRERFAV